MAPSLLAPVSPFNSVAHEPPPQRTPAVTEVATPAVAMLVYHRIGDPASDARHPELSVSVDAFAAQLAMLRRMGYSAVTVRDYVNHRHCGAPLPPRPVVVTFDDGYADNYSHAFPALADTGVPATIFLVAERLGATNTWDDDDLPDRLLSLAEVREMQRGGIDFQSHTATHRRLTAIPARDVESELARSREALEQSLGERVDAVAYPWGAHDEQTMRLAAESGYVAGLGTRRRVNFLRTPMLALRRIPVYRSTRRRSLAWDLLRLPFRGD